MLSILADALLIVARMNPRQTDRAPLDQGPWAGPKTPGHLSALIGRRA